MNIIFLDVDGVLNGYNIFSDTCYKIAKKLHLPRSIKNIFDPFRISERRIKFLSEIVHKTKAKVVLSSSLRKSYWEIPYEKKIGDLKRLEELFRKYNLEIIDITPQCVSNRREDEIISWLARNEKKVDNFVILDDERSNLECFVGSNLVQTSSIKEGEIIKGYSSENTGLKKKHIKMAVDILSIKKVD